MILTGKEILKRMERNQIKIDPFDERQLNPNSYNVRLHPELKVYTEPVLDSRRENPTEAFRISSDGIQLEPGILYLGRTVEFTAVEGPLVPDLDGRSSYGRLGVEIHVCAGRGDVGFAGFWTLEIRVTHPTIIYPYCEIGQLYFTETVGELTYYKGKYQHSLDVIPSRAYMDRRDS